MDKKTAVSYMNGWNASLKLEFAYRSPFTRLIKRQHQGPLVFQKVLYPEGQGTAHGLIVHPPGGVAGGDSLDISFQLNDESQVLLTTPGATKWYKSLGRRAKQSIHIQQGQDTVLEWLPQENIVFDGADADISTTVALTGNAIFSTWEITCLGRKASGESWQNGRLKQCTEVFRDENLIWYDSVVLRPDSPVLSSMSGLRDRLVFGNMILAASDLPQDLIKACREIALSSEALYGVSALPDIFTARYIGDCAQEARQYFEAIWSCLRPWYAAKNAVRPRIWAT